MIFLLFAINLHSNIEFCTQKINGCKLIPFRARDMKICTKTAIWVDLMKRFSSLSTFLPKKIISYYILWQKSSLLSGVWGAVHGWIGDRTKCQIRQLKELLNSLSWTSCHSVVVWLSVYVRGRFPKAFLYPNHGVI